MTNSMEENYKEKHIIVKYVRNKNKEKLFKTEEKVSYVIFERKFK
jgi:hypothetical protein